MDRVGEAKPRPMSDEKSECSYSSFSEDGIHRFFNEMFVAVPSTNGMSPAEELAFSVQCTRQHENCSPHQDFKTEITCIQFPSSLVHCTETASSSSRIFLPLCNEPSLPAHFTTSWNISASSVSSKHQSMSWREGSGAVSKDSNDDPPMPLRSLPIQMSNESWRFHKSACIDKWYSLREADDSNCESHEYQVFECTIPVDVMIKVFGFDPRLSPFTVTGYPLLSSMKDNLNCLNLPLIERNYLHFVRRDDGLFECVGQGSYGCVFVAEITGRKGHLVVKDYINDCVTIEMIEHEARILKYLADTDFVPEFIGLVNSSASTSGYSLVQEYFGEGLTIHKLLMSKDRLSKLTWMRICCQLVFGLECIHTKHVLINDIKSDNVLADLVSGAPKVKYIDMGLASYRQGIRFGDPRPQIDEYRYLAPEVCMGSFSSPLSDIYSLGHLLGQIGRKGQISELVSVSEACLVELPVDRISLKDLKEKLVHILMELELEETTLLDR